MSDTTSPYNSADDEEVDRREEVRSKDPHGDDEQKRYDDPVLNQTLKACQSGGYMVKNNPVSFDKEAIRKSMQANVKYYKAPELPKESANFPNPQIYVEQRDAVDVATELAKEKKGQVLLLNMANKDTPGLAQPTSSERNLLRRSNYFLHLTTQGHNMMGVEKKWKYPIPEDGAIYSPNVLFFRTSKDANTYGPLPEPIAVNCIALSPLDWPPDPESNIDAYNEGTKKKFITLLSVAIQKRCTNLVLGAFGCEGVTDPPRHVPSLFATVIHLPEFRNKFERIVFAIENDGTKRSRDEPYEEMFGKERAAEPVQPSPPANPCWLENLSSCCFFKSYK